MNKKVLLIFVLCLFGLMLSMSLVSASSSGNFWEKVKNFFSSPNSEEKPTGMALLSSLVVYTCSDNDGGKNYSKVGTITIKRSIRTLGTLFGVRTSIYQTYQYKDSCNESKLTEFYCKTGKGTSMGSVFGVETYTCPNGCKDGACLAAFEPIIKNFTSVAVIKIHYTNYSLEDLQSKINAIFSKHPNVDLIATPEYLFYGAGFGGRDYRNDPVIVNCQENNCSLVSIGTEKSGQLKNEIEAVKYIAKQNNVNIILGTVAEMEEINGIRFTFDTQLIINRQGNIIGKHRMHPVIYSLADGNQNYCAEPVNAVVCEQARNSILETNKVFTLTTKQEKYFKIIPIICGEKNDDKVIARLNNSNADFAVISEIDVDCNYESLTKRIQAGENIFENTQQFTCEWILKIVFDKWTANKLLKEGIIVISDGAVPSAGVFNYNLKKIQNLEVTEDYTYGEIGLS